MSKTKTVLNDGSKHDNPFWGRLECSSEFTDLWHILVPQSPCKYIGIHILNNNKKKRDKKAVAALASKYGGGERKLGGGQKCEKNALNAQFFSILILKSSNLV